MRTLNIAVFTSNRSEYGLLRPLLDAIEHEPSFNLSLLVGGSHLSEHFGYTIKDIEADKRNIAAKFDFLPQDMSDDYLTRSLGLLQEQIGNWLFNNKPDWIIVLGDRYELVAVAAAALLYQIPLAHISGGDVTEGAVDNQVRHAVSKIASVHFPANDVAKKKLISLGEEEWRICVSGEPGLDQVLSMNYLTKDELFNELELSKDSPTAIITFHPDTLSKRINPDLIKETCEKLILNGFQIIATGSNFDEGGKEINDSWSKISNSSERIKFRMSLGQKRYYSMLKYVDLMIGNSSSGIVEAQSFNIPVVNVGSRQLGRLANPNVVNADPAISSISSAIEKAISKEFKQQFFNKPNLYGYGKASQRIVDFLKVVPRDKLLSKS